MALEDSRTPENLLQFGPKAADPNPALSIEEVRAHYAGIYRNSTTPHLRRRSPEPSTRSPSVRCWTQG